MSPFSVRQQCIGLMFWLLVCFITAAIGAAASVQASEVYAALARPPWAPPAFLFGPVWTLLYALMAIAAWLAWRTGGFRQAPRAAGLFMTQLVLNALWSWLFFGWQLGAAALVDILLLWALIAATLLSFWRLRPLAGLLLVPYLLWVSFAALLNLSLWQMNPQVLG